MTEYLILSGTDVENTDQESFIDYLQDIAEHDCNDVADMEDPKPTSETETVSAKDLFYSNGSYIIFRCSLLDDCKVSSTFLSGFKSFEAETTSPPPKA